MDFMKEVENSTLTHKKLINIVCNQVKEKVTSVVELGLIQSQPLPILKEMNKILEKNPTISIQKLLDSVDWVNTIEEE